jgi:hypothetical protein
MAESLFPHYGRRIARLEADMTRAQASFAALLARYEGLVKDMKGNDLLARVRKLEKDVYNPD